MAAEMIAAAGGDVHGAEDFFVLDVTAGDGEVLGAETEFAEFAGHRVALELIVVGVDEIDVAASVGLHFRGAGILLPAVGAARGSRRAARWIARVGEGAIEGWSLAYYTPEWGNLIDIPRLIGGVEAGNLVLSCLVVVKPPAEPERDDGYRDVAAKGVVVGRLDATPWLGGLTAARRGEDDVRRMLRAFAIGFALAIVPMGFAVFVTFFTPWRGR